MRFALGADGSRWGRDNTPKIRTNYVVDVRTPTSLTPANWVKKRIHWEMRSPTFRIPYGEDPTLLPAVAAQQVVAKQVRDYLRDRYPVGTYRLPEVTLGPGGLATALPDLPYTGFSKTVSTALAGARLMTFDVYCELLAVLGPDAVPTTSALVDAMGRGLQGVGKWPDDGTWKPRQTRPAMGLAGARATKGHVSTQLEVTAAEQPHPDGDVALSGLLVQLGDAIDAWGGPGTTDSLEVEVDVYVGEASANLVVTNDALTGQMWMPADWGTRIAEEVRSPGGVLVLDDEGEHDISGFPVSLYRVVAPLVAFEPDAWDNDMYLAIGDGVAKVWQDADGGGIEWLAAGRG